MIVTQLALWDVAGPGRLENISEEMEVHEYGVMYGKGKTEPQKWKLEKVLYTTYGFTFSFYFRNFVPLTHSEFRTQIELPETKQKINRMIT